MKKVYVEPQVEIKKYQIEDVITTSGVISGGEVNADIASDPVAGEGISSAVVYNSFFG